jgi:hypothetical protein
MHDLWLSLMPFKSKKQKIWLRINRPDKKKEKANLWKFFKAEDPALGKMGLSLAEGIGYNTDEAWASRQELADMADERWEEAVTDIRNLIRRINNPDHPITESVQRREGWKTLPELRFRKSYWDWIGSVLRTPWATDADMEGWVVEDYESLKEEKAKK